MATEPTDGDGLCKCEERLKVLEKSLNELFKRDNDIEKKYNDVDSKANNIDNKINHIDRKTNDIELRVGRFLWIAGVVVFVIVIATGVVVQQIPHWAAKSAHEQVNILVTDKYREKLEEYRIRADKAAVSAEAAQKRVKAIIHGIEQNTITTLQQRQEALDMALKALKIGEWKYKPIELVIGTQSIQDRNLSIDIKELDKKYEFTYPQPGKVIGVWCECVQSSGELAKFYHIQSTPDNDTIKLNIWAVPNQPPCCLVVRLHVIYNEPNKN